MAVIPRNYGSGNQTTPAVNNVKLDPNLAAAPYRAQEQSSAYLQSVFGRELDAWGRVFQQEEEARKAAEAKQIKVAEGLYKAEAMANVHVQANNLYQQLKQSSDGTTSFAPEFDKQFQALAQKAIQGAPTQESQVDLTKALISTRSSMFARASNESLSQNNQINMDRLENMLGQYESLAAANPGSVADIKKQSADVFASMGQLGIPEIARKRIMDKFDKRLDYHAIRAEADLNPLETLDKIKSGAVAHLGEGNTNALLNYTNSAISASTARANSAIADLQNKISSGYAVPEVYSSIVAEAEKYGLKDKADIVKSLVELDKQTASLPAADMAVAASQLKSAVLSGQIDASPDKLKALIGFLEGNANAIKEDGISYAERKGGFPPLPMLDVATADPKQLEDRKFKAAQVKALYGTSTPALKQAEVMDISNKLITMGPDDISKVSATLAALGQDTVEAVAKSLDKKDTGLAMVIRIGADNPDIVSNIVRGKELAKSAPYDPKTQTDLIDAAGNFLVNNPALREQYIHAAKAYMLDSASRGTILTPQDALDKVAGTIKMDLPGLFTGNLTTHAPKAGMSSREFRSFLDNNLKDPKNWEQFASGMPVDANGNPMKWKNIGPSDLLFPYNGNGNYSIIFNTQPLRDANGNPITINLKGLANKGQ